MTDPVNASIVDHFQTLEEPRLERTKKHNLLAMLVLAWGTLWTGGAGGQAMALLGKRQHAWRHTFLALPPGMPSHDTCGRVLARLHPRRLPECLLSSTRAVAQLTQETLVSLDGKTVQAACARATAASPLPMLAAGCSEHGGLVMGPTRTDSQSHAIPAIPDLRPWLASQGGLVTSDARGCQTAIAARMQAPGGDALWALQANHTKAYQAIHAHWHASEPNPAWHNEAHGFDAFDDTHGRTVRRRVGPLTDLTVLPAWATWPGLQTVMVVETIRMAHQHAPVTSDDRVSLASLGRSATTCVTMSRQHGDIEHTRQWSLDVTFNADRGRLRTDPAAENRVALRHVALHLVRQEPSRRIRLRQQRLFGSLDEHYLLTIIARVT